MTATGLFDSRELPASAEVSAAPVHFAAVALEQGIDRVLDYSIPARLVGRVVSGQLARIFTPIRR
jgi:hypothetical protein